MRDKRRGWILAALVAGMIVTVALTVAGGLLGARAYAQQREEERRHEILHTAKQVAVNLHSLDYRTLDKDLELIQEGTTGEVAKQFKSKSDVLHKLLPKSKVVADGKALGAGIISADTDSAKVLVAADSTVRNTKAPDGVVRHYRLWMALERHGDRWLVSDMAFAKYGLAR